MKMIKKIIRKLSVYMLMFTISALILTTQAFAENAGENAGASAWNTVMDFIIPWISRLGGAVMLIGGVQFGLAFKSEDADGKTRALQTIIAGAIVVAVGVSAHIFLQ